MGWKNANYFGCQAFVNNNTNSRSYCCPVIAFNTWFKSGKKNSCTSSKLVSYIITKKLCTMLRQLPIFLFRLESFRVNGPNGVSTKPDAWEVSGHSTGNYTRPRPALTKQIIKYKSNCRGAFWRFTSYPYMSPRHEPQRRHGKHVVPLVNLSRTLSRKNYAPWYGSFQFSFFVWNRANGPNGVSTKPDAWEVSGLFFGYVVCD